MTLFVLLVSVPALLFCCLALVHFQQEIRKGEAAGLAGGRKIRLDSQDAAAWGLNFQTDDSEKRSQPEVYQPESFISAPSSWYAQGMAGIGTSPTHVTSITEFHLWPDHDRRACFMKSLGLVYFIQMPGAVSFGMRVSFKE